VLWLRRVILGALYPPTWCRSRPTYTRNWFVMLIGLAAERDPDCGVCQRRIRKKARPLVTPHSKAPGAARPILMTFFFGSFSDRAALDGHRRGIGSAPDHEHHGDRRNAGGEHHRNYFHPRDFLHSGEGLGAKAHAPGMLPRSCAGTWEIEISSIIHRSIHLGRCFDRCVGELPPWPQLP